MPSFVLLVAFVGYFVTKKISNILLTLGPFAGWYEAHQERKILAMQEEDDGEKST